VLYTRNFLDIFLIWQLHKRDSLRLMGSILPARFSAKTLRRVAQVPGEVRTTNINGCSRCFALGRLAEHEPRSGQAQKRQPIHISPGQSSSIRRYA
jgi:hypothetical protein